MPLALFILVILGFCLTGCIQEIKDGNKNAIVGLVVISIFILAFCFVLLRGRVDIEVLLYGFCAIMLLVGLSYVIVTLKGRIKVKKINKYDEQYTYKVHGKVVDCIKAVGSCTCVYEFYDKGVTRTIRSCRADGDSVRINRPIGSDVVIVVNGRTGEAYCEEDEEYYSKADRYLVVFIVVVVLYVLVDIFLLK